MSLIVKIPNPFAAKKELEKRVLALESYAVSDVVRISKLENDLDSLTLVVAAAIAVAIYFYVTGVSNVDIK